MMKTRWYLLLLWFLMDSAFAAATESTQAGWMTTIFFLASAAIAILTFKLLKRLAKRPSGNTDGNDSIWSSASHELGTNSISDSTRDDNGLCDSGDCGGGGDSGD
ncbi:MAG: hypothetical protein PHU06_12185 [Gallionella sp.]|nr:hypothetical protein [Gallionella sp.]MDD4960220.1 hypothetical protein [Gallionella sp.]